MRANRNVVEPAPTEFIYSFIDRQIEKVGPTAILLCEFTATAASGKPII